ncbi:transcriptional regulator [Vibrio sp.]|uniref:winged helix-turn-helix domain-containing protein n=1 Tax=Vibrio sp. TaxID=678 RepID=UPI00311D71F1
MSNIGTKFNLSNRFTFDPNTNSLVDNSNDNSEIIRLGSNESRILLLLSEKPNEIVSRNELHDFVWREQGFEVDDSSLTQAISTLRKQLQDSTKSPQFIKTVPKRGYQLICSVERTTPLMSGADPQEEETLDTTHLDNEITSDISEDDTKYSTSALIKLQAEQISAESTKPRWGIRAMLLLALLIPLSVILFTNPAESTFRQIAMYDGTPVKTPINHPDLTPWYPSIEQCVKRYNLAHSSKEPVEVIATGGQNNQLVLNYIHSVASSGENVTVRIFADQKDLNKVCQ